MVTDTMGHPVPDASLLIAYTDWSGFSLLSNLFQKCKLV